MAHMYFLGNSTPGQMMGFVIQTERKTVVIDGGTQGDYVQLAQLLKKEAGSHVDAWFFTHPHHDHIGAFSEICKKESDIEIEGIYCCFPPFEMLYERGSRADWEIRIWQYFEKLFKSRFTNSVHKIKKDQVFEFDNIKINVLRVYNPGITENFINNSSCVYRIDAPDTRVLILGDLGAEAGEEVMKICSPKSLYADYTQMAHHGQNGVNKEFYQYICPRKCLWPAPDWLWDNDNGRGFNSGPWKTVETRGWMGELGVTEHFVEKDGTVKIEL